ncbi:MAG TPA: malonyl-CoA decarboxylase [Acetobacteraceae bacterium]
MAAVRDLSSIFGSHAWIERLWSSIADKGRAFASVPSEARPPLQRAQLLAKALLSGRGEASGAAVARELHAVLHDLNGADRLEFYRFLATDFAPDPDQLRHAAEAYLGDPSPEQAAQLTAAADPPRQELLRRMNVSLGGTAALVAMRKELLGLLREEPGLKPLDSDLRHLLGSWFNLGFLQLRRIDWQTPAATLEKLIAYEAVHAIQGWDDLRRRLAPDRRCFGFFHPALPGEPLIFVEVALVNGLSASIQPLLEPVTDERAAAAAAARADTAIFYSINNCRDGLRGVSFGNFLIKQVVDELTAELPALTCFSTLSPVPGFRRWLDKYLTADPANQAMLSDAERAALSDGTSGDEATLLRDALHEDEWWADAIRADLLHMPLLRLCATYLTETTDRGADPVARFHLGNGARLERINWLGNLSPRGIQESWGIMVNYLYEPSEIEANHEMFVRDGTVVRSLAVDALKEPCQPKRRARAARSR